MVSIGAMDGNSHLYAAEVVLGAQQRSVVPGDLVRRSSTDIIQNALADLLSGPFQNETHMNDEGLRYKILQSLSESHYGVAVSHMLHDRGHQDSYEGAERLLAVILRDLAGRISNFRAALYKTMAPGVDRELDVQPTQDGTRDIQVQVGSVEEETVIDHLHPHITDLVKESVNNVLKAA